MPRNVMKSSAALMELHDIKPGDAAAQVELRVLRIKGDVVWLRYDQLAAGSERFGGDGNGLDRLGGDGLGGGGLGRDRGANQNSHQK